jgi:AcrR family transcriptional regulator
MSEPAAGAEPRQRKERTENAARRRGQLVEAALRSIVKKGLGGTTLATVAAEAGLSQGVAVFYFQTKEGLLAAALQHHYELYEANWRRALDAAPADPALRLAALVRADFDDAVCAREAQIVWHAYWGEASARPMFAAIAERFDKARSDALESAVAALLGELGRDTSASADIGAGVEALTDGLWLQLYLTSGVPSPEQGLAISFRFLAALFPERKAAFPQGRAG